MLESCVLAVTLKLKGCMLYYGVCISILDLYVRIEGKKIGDIQANVLEDLSICVYIIGWLGLCGMGLWGVRRLFCSRLSKQKQKVCWFKYFKEATLPTKGSK